MKALKVIKTIFLYFMGIFFLIQACFGFSVTLKAAIPILCCAILTLPFVHKLIDKGLEKKGKKPIKWWVYLIVVVVIWCVGMCNWPAPEKKDEPPVQTEQTYEKNDEQPTNTDSTEVNTEETDEEPEPEKSTVAESDGIAEKLMSIGFNESEAAEIRNIMLECGIENIDFLEPNDPKADINGLAPYRVKYDKDRILAITFDQRKLYYIAFNGTDIYDSGNGGVIRSVKDVHVPETKMTEAQKITLRDKTESVLDKYFTHIPYYDAWGFAREDDNFMVQCEAYAKNNLGVSKYLPVRVWYTKNGDDYTVVGVSIDGQQYDVK